MIREYYEKELLGGLHNRSKIVKFEELIKTPAGVLQSIFQFFGVQCSEEIVGGILARGLKGEIALAGRKITSTRIKPPIDRFSQLPSNDQDKIRKLMNELRKKMGYEEK